MMNGSVHQSKVRAFLAVFAGLLSLPGLPAKDIPAFPEAEGHGSLRAAVAAEGRWNRYEVYLDACEELMIRCLPKPTRLLS